MRAKLWRPSASAAGTKSGRWCTALTGATPSSSRMVPVAVASAMRTPEGSTAPGRADSVTVNVSSGSTSASCVVATEKVAEVCPAAMRMSCASARVVGALRGGVARPRGGRRRELQGAAQLRAGQPSP